MLDVNEIALRHNTKEYGIVNISVANLRKQAVFQSELANQLLMGTIVPIFESQNGFCYIENWDGFRGWISEASLLRVNRARAEAWHTEARSFFRENYGVIRRGMAGSEEPVTDAVSGVILKSLEVGAEKTRIELPDGRTGFVETDACVGFDGTVRSDAKTETAQTARKFLGIPYLWGGTSTKAFDCSGFVQTVYRFLDRPLPRDASDMARLGEEIPRQSLEVGDLLFFGKTDIRITHVALFLGESLYMHADGHVHINSIDPGHEQYNADRGSTFVKAIRLPAPPNGSISE